MQLAKLLIVRPHAEQLPRGPNPWHDACFKLNALQVTFRDVTPTEAARREFEAMTMQPIESRVSVTNSGTPG